MLEGGAVNEISPEEVGSYAEISCSAGQHKLDYIFFFVLKIGRGGVASQGLRVGGQVRLV